MDIMLLVYQSQLLSIKHLLDRICCKLSSLLPGQSHEVSDAVGVNSTKALYCSVKQVIKNPGQQIASRTFECMGCKH